MSFSYTPDLSVPINYLRFRLDDKEEEYRNYEDEELQYFIDKVSGTPTELDLDKIALRLLKQQLQELLRSPSRERAGNYEIYLASAQSLKAAISELEDDINSTINVPSMYAGGIDRTDYCNNKHNDQLVDSKFERGEFFGDDDCCNERSDRIGY